jgi:hypothetical protein
MRLSALLAAVFCAALFVAGCGGGSGNSGESSSTAPKKATAPNAPAGSKVVACGDGDAQLRATAVDCGTADRIMRHWRKHRSCALAAGASRGSCALGAFRCQAVRADPGIAVSCAHPGGDVSFLVKE